MAQGVTLKTIGARVGYSKNTVSLALRGDPQIPVQTRDRIRKVAREMGYQRNALVAHLMAQLRANQSSAPFQAKLALVNAHQSRDAFQTHPTIPTYVAGCEARASQLGYSFDNFWLHDPELTADRWIRILTARGIKGIVIVGLMHQNRLPDHLRPVWNHFPTVVTGVRTRDPALSFSCVDHYHLTFAAVEKARELGYRRPGLVIDDAIDRLVDGRFSAGMLAAQDALPEAERIRTFKDVKRDDPAAFYQWFDHYSPDVVLILYNNVIHWLEARGITAPNDVGLIQLEWRASHPQLAGMNQHNYQAGKAAVDMVVNEIHRNKSGVPEFPLATLIGASWVDGASVRSDGWRQQTRTERDDMTHAAGTLRTESAAAALERRPLAEIPSLARIVPC